MAKWIQQIQIRNPTGHAVLSGSCREQVTHTCEVGFRGGIILDARGSELGLGLECMDDLGWFWVGLW